MAAHHWLGNLCSENRTPIVVLLLEFFRYYAFEYDYRHNVVSIHGSNMNKSEYCEAHCWRTNDRLCIADPFEVWYDVAHVIKPAKMTIIRKELIVSILWFMLSLILLIE